MKIINAQKIALLIALLAAVIIGIVEFSIFFLGLERYSPVFAASMVIVFIAVYSLVFLLLNNFIFQKINPIYKTINKLEKSEKQLRKELDKRDMIDDLNREVEDWATGKTQEIDQLKEMAQYRQEFLGNVSRELKAPIYSMQEYITVLQDNSSDDPEKNRVYLERAGNSTGKLINIVEDLDIIRQLDSGEIKIEFENFDIAQLARKIFGDQKKEAQKQHIELIVKNNNGEPLMVHADKKRIEEAMTNLIVNSIKYGKNEGCTAVEFTDLEDNILVEVSDNGMGIPNDDLPRIFERFYRVDKARPLNQSGTGLGLAIVKHIIEAHNQAINVKSKENEGSTFAFTLRKGV